MDFDCSFNPTNNSSKLLNTGKKNETDPTQSNGFFDRQKGIRVPSVSFVDVVKGRVRDQKEKTEKTKKEDQESTTSEREHVGVQVKPRVISLTSCDTQERIEVKCFNFLDGIANLCLCEGFGGGVVKYLGGAWVLLDVKGEEEEAKSKTCSDVPTREGDNVEEDEEDKGESEEDDHLEQLEEDASEWGTKLDLEKDSCETVVKESIQFPREKNDVDENAEEQLESDGDGQFSNVRLESLAFSLGVWVFVVRVAV
ncbi:hypothetical protein L2E82_10151 [Cichorium intybus]|uniref:Uncharacterized protein n=1 Tax=Cichorium intybus TaxID=13427 RepID=A0ACB9G9U7_CICIN|nr:hypothetical protein L2E82_10151 [Cichorium intybus]